MSTTIFSRFDDDPPPALPKELRPLRALLDTRLSALEEALATPDQYASIERRLNDLVQAATEEADEPYGRLTSMRSGKRAIPLRRPVPRQRRGLKRNGRPAPRFGRTSSRRAPLFRPSARRLPPSAVISTPHG